MVNLTKTLSCGNGNVHHWLYTDYLPIISPFWTVKSPFHPFSEANFCNYLLNPAVFCIFSASVRAFLSLLHVQQGRLVLTIHLCQPRRKIALSTRKMMGFHGENMGQLDTIWGFTCVEWDFMGINGDISWEK